ncbi:MAG: amidohydrolase [Flavobacteriales bacterium]
MKGGNQRIVFIGVLLSLFSCVKFKKADLVIHNARIYTANEIFEVAQAMAITDGKIVMIGKEHEIMNKYRASEIIDAETRPIYPGFIDAHCHFLGSGLNGLAIDLSDCKSFDEVIKKLHTFKTENSNSNWLVGYGWDENKWISRVIDYPRLNEHFHDIPVVLWRVDGHSLIVNKVALSKTSLKTIDYNGVVKEADIHHFTKAINYTKQQKKNALRNSEQAFFKQGVTTVSDAGLTKEEVELIQMMQNSGTLDMRIYAMLFPDKNTLEMESIFTDRLTVNSYKLMLDGSVGSQSACFKSPYRGTTNYGKLLMTRDSLARIARLAYDKGFQLNVHAIGDSAVKVALVEMGKVLKETNGMTWRIEHAQAVSEEDVKLFSQYNIIPSVQPTHMIDDMKAGIVKGVDKESLKNSYRLKSLLEQNQIIALGTDFPVADKNPVVTFYNAVVRNSRPEFPIAENESLSREEALKGITFWPALANKEYETKGTLEVGKFADFVILNRDIMKVPEEEIKDAKVVSTFVDGVVVYESE